MNLLVIKHLKKNERDNRVTQKTESIQILLNLININKISRTWSTKYQSLYHHSSKFQLFWLLYISVSQTFSVRFSQAPPWFSARFPAPPRFFFRGKECSTENIYL